MMIHLLHVTYQDTCQLISYLRSFFIQLKPTFNIFFNGTAEKVSTESNTNEKLKRDSSEPGAKTAPAERLRPIGASAEEEMCEGEGKFSTDTKQHEDGGERAVHIIIKPQEEERNQEPSQCFPPII